MAEKSFIEQLDQTAEPEGGTGVFCQAELFMAVKTFLPDEQPDFGLEPYELGNDESYAKAREAITNLLESRQLDPTSPKIRPTKVFAMKLFRDTVYGRTWENDLTKLLATYGDGYRKIVLPKLKELAQADKFTAFGKKYWVHVSVLPDPKRTEKDKETGEERPAGVWMIDEIYPSEKAMIEAAKAFVPEAAPAAASVDGMPPAPEGYSADMWAKYWPEISKLAGEIKAGGLAPRVQKDRLEQLATDYGVPVDLVS